MKTKLFFYSLIAFHFLSGSQLGVLTYNIHALTPIIARDNPHKRIPEILSKSSGIDILFFQENWIFKDPELEPHLSGYNIITSKTSKLMWPFGKLINPHGSGLFMAIADKIKIVDIIEESFDRCSGWISKEHDCLSPKGFQHVKVHLDGKRLDLYNTHLDAGGSKLDVSARKSQIKHIASYISQNSVGYPVIIAGDLNVDLNSDEFAIVSWLIDEIDLQISGWSDQNSHSNLGKVDYILYRGSENLNISLESCEIDLKLNGLSDHPPIKALFNYKN